MRKGRKSRRESLPPLCTAVISSSSSQPQQTTDHKQPKLLCSQQGAPGYYTRDGVAITHGPTQRSSLDAVEPLWICTGPDEAPGIHIRKISSCLPVLTPPGAAAPELLLRLRNTAAGSSGAHASHPGTTKFTLPLEILPECQRLFQEAALKGLYQPLLPTRGRAAGQV